MYSSTSLSAPIPRTINQSNDIVALLPRDELRSLHHLSRWKGLAHVVLEWSVILSAAYLSNRYFSLPLYLLVWALIGGRLLGLGIIMHEAVHGLLHPNKFLNEFVGEVCCSWPLLISLRSYRQKHLAHHRWVNTDKDPDFVGKTEKDWAFPMRRLRLIRVLLLQMIGVGAISSFQNMSNAKMKTDRQPNPLWYNILRIGFYIVISIGVSFAGLWKELCLYWLIPLLTWTQFANRLRRIAEHSAVEGLEAEFQTRTTLHGWLARIFLVPNNINYHNEHHLLPGVPWYRLPQVHRLFRGIEQARKHMHTTKAYRGVFKEILKE